jgi:hypothetical protein
MEDVAMQPSSPSRPSVHAFVACCCACLITPPAWAPPLDQDEIVLCNANDAEITANLMAYQLKLNVLDLDEHLFVRRLVPDPPLDDIGPDTVFFGVDVDLGGGLPPLSDSHNGPEIGHDSNAGWEVVYTLANIPVPGQWRVAWRSNACFFWLGDTLWKNCWVPRQELPNDQGWANRWFPFASTVAAQPAKVAYLVGDEDRDETNRRLA